MEEFSQKSAEVQEFADSTEEKADAAEKRAGKTEKSGKTAESGGQTGGQNKKAESSAEKSTRFQAVLRGITAVEGGREKRAEKSGHNAGEQGWEDEVRESIRQREPISGEAGGQKVAVFAGVGEGDADQGLVAGQ